MMKIVATIEARMGSTRLPGKVLMNIGAWKSLDLQIARLRRSKLIDEIVLATTDNASDNVLEDFATEVGIRCFRGSENDVLGRILGAAKMAKGELQVQITGDCPLIDPCIVDQVISIYLESFNKYDFVSNEIERSYPIGLDCRVFSVDLLDKVGDICDDPVHRVHGSTYIYVGSGKEKYRSYNLLAPYKVRHPGWRWTLDTKEDLLFLTEIAKGIGDHILEIDTDELTDWLLERPQILAINSNVNQKDFADG